MWLVTMDSPPPLPVAPRPFLQEAFGGWIGRLASCYRMSVLEFAQQMGLDLDGQLSGVGWLLLPAQSARTLGRLADLARLEPAVLRAIETPDAWTHRRKQYLYCARCVFVNPEDVASPYWKRQWLSPAATLCDVHASPLRAIPSGRVNRCLNLVLLLTRVAEYEREPPRNTYDWILR
jgi:TniQ